MNADIDTINDNLEIVLIGCVDEYHNMLADLRLGHLIIESPWSVKAQDQKLH